MILNFIGNSNIYIPNGNNFDIDENGEVVFYSNINITSNINNNNNNDKNSNILLSSIRNKGLFDLNSSLGGNIELPVDNSGLISIGKNIMNINGIDNTGESFYQSSHIISKNRKLKNNNGGSSQGILYLEGDFDNDGDIVNDINDGSLFEIDGEYSSSKSSVIYALIENTSKPGSGFTFIDISKSASLNGRIEICIPDTANLGNTKKLDLLKFNEKIGEFDEIIFRCSSKHKSLGYNDKKSISKNTNNILLKSCEIKQLKSVENGCTTTEYSSGSFSVLFDGCGSNSNDEKYIYQWLSLGFAGLAIILVIIIIIIFDFVPPFKRIIKGGEGARISNVRKVREKYRSKGLTSLESLQSTTIE